MRTNRNMLGNFNEVGVEAFIIACLGQLLMIISYFGYPILFKTFGNVFCIFAIMLSICAFIDMRKYHKRGYYGFAIAALCLASIGFVCRTITIIIVSI